MTALREPLLTATVRYGYFVLQVRATRGPERMELTGILENLGTGEKKSFEGSGSLTRLIDEWARQAGGGA